MLLKKSLEFVGLDTTYAQFREGIESVNIYEIIYVGGLQTPVSNTDSVDLKEEKKRSIVFAKHNKGV